jgi:hypothetical protein
MNENDAIIAVLSKLECEPPSEVSYQWLCAAVEIGIRAIYRAGLAITEKETIDNIRETRFGA